MKIFKNYVYNMYISRYDIEFENILNIITFYSVLHSTYIHTSPVLNKKYSNSTQFFVYYFFIRQIGHFTAMAQEKNTHCGCAAAFYYENGMNWFLMACNYATTNWVGEPVYQRGVKASGCKKGTNVNYPGLCKVSEVYNV